jgi:Protein of unknown function (DUF2905)
VPTLLAFFFERVGDFDLKALITERCGNRLSGLLYFGSFSRNFEKLDRAAVRSKSGTQPSRKAADSVTVVGKLLIVLGAVLLVAGVLFTVLGKMNLPLGRLPGDIIYRGKNTTFYFPLATSVLVSVVLSLVLYVVGRWRH